MHIENCVVSGFTGTGTSAGVGFQGISRLEVKDSIIKDNHAGITVNSGSAAIDRVRLDGNDTGLVVLAGASVTVRDSLASGGVTGFLAMSATSAAAEMNIEGCIASNGAVGITVQSTSTGIATARVSNSVVTDNALIGLFNAGGPALLLSRGNNTVEGNGTDTEGSIGSYSAK